MTNPTPPYVPIAGLRVPATLVPRIVAAFRGQYPTITAGLGDDAAIRAVLKYWTVSTLEAWESRAATNGLAPAVDAVQAEYAAKSEQARQRATQDGDSIINPA